MILRTIAIDYDGTIADHGVLNSCVREAILEARSAGLYVVIVTGRILRELRKVAGDLTFVDGVVAENGAVLLLANGHRRLLGPPPFPIFLQELSARGIEFVVGRCLIDMDEEHAETVLSIIRKTNLPLMIAFNKSRIMVLPRSISKSSGLCEMCDILGTSIHNTIGIGDAENDYELIKHCEYGIAVPWAAEFIKSEADFVLPGNNQDSVAAYIRRVSLNKRLPTRGMSHRSFILESKVGQSSFEISHRGRNTLIAGDSKSGKSWIAGLFCEQMILQRYTVFVIDPEGDYGSLTSLPNTIMFGAGNPLPRINELLLLFRQGLSIILNLSHLDSEDKTSYIRELLPLAANYRKSKGYPHAILIDECHCFMDEEISKDILDPELGSYILVTYLPSLLPRKVIQSTEVIVATRMTEKVEVDAIRAATDQKISDDWYKILANLETTEAALLPPTDEANGQPRHFTVVPRLTLHVRHRNKYLNRRLRPDQAFVYTNAGTPVGETAITLQALAESAKGMGEDVINGHVLRHDFSHWIIGEFNDLDLAMDVQNLEAQNYKRGESSRFAAQLSVLIEQRYR